MSTYTNFLDIYEDTINEQMQRAEDIFVAAVEFIRTHGGDVLNEGTSIINESGDSFADGIKERLDDCGISVNNITNSLIDAAFCELTSWLYDEPLLQALHINNVEIYINCDDSHISINGMELMDADDFITLAEDTYCEYAKTLYSDYISTNTDYSDKFKEFAIETLDDTVKQDIDNGLLDFVDDIAVTMKEGVDSRSEELDAFIADSVKEAYKEYTKKLKEKWLRPLTAD